MTDQQARQQGALLDAGGGVAVAADIAVKCCLCAGEVAPEYRMPERSRWDQLCGPCIWRGVKDARRKREGSA